MLGFPGSSLWPGIFCFTGLLAKYYNLFKVDKTGSNNVVLPTLSLVVNNIVQHSY
jgi:hypothetical protein